jgi:hypothetical protein
MVKHVLGLALMGVGGWFMLGRQPRAARAFGDDGIPYRPDYSGRAFGDAGIPYSRDALDNGAGEGLSDGRLNLGWLDELFPPSQPSDLEDGRLELGWLDGWGNDRDQGSGGNSWFDDDWSIFDMTDPRGIRNNNPGNIEYTGTQWQGLDSPPSDGRFMVFSDPLYGIRAMSRVLDTYRDSHNLNTVQSIISRWAPAHENDTRNYSRYVAERVGVEQTQTLNDSHRPDLIAAMIEMENGTQPYSMATIRQGISMA